MRSRESFGLVIQIVLCSISMWYDCETQPHKEVYAQTQLLQCNLQRVLRAGCDSWIQILLRRPLSNAVVVELVRHAGLKILHEDTLWVRIPPAVPNFKCVCDSTVECQTSSFLHFKGCFVFQSERVYPLIIPWWDSSLVWWTTIQRGSRLVVLAPFL